MQPHFFYKKPRIPPLIVLMEDSGFACKSSNNPYLQSNNSMLFNMQAFPKNIFLFIFLLC